MKVVLVGRYPEPGANIGGGVARVIDALMPHLAARIDLTLVVPAAAADGVTTVHGVPVHYLKRGPGPGALSYWTFDAARVGRCIAALRPDLVHLQALGGVGRMVSEPRIMTIHGIADQAILRSGRGRIWEGQARRISASLVGRVERRGRSDLRGVIVVNPYVREALPDIEDLPQWDIPNPLDSRFISGPPTAEGTRGRRMITVGRITPLKATRRIIEIGLKVMADDPQAELVVCGSPSPHAYGEECRALVRSSPARDRVTFLHDPDDARLLTELDRSSVLLMASLHEGAPMVIPEANARGVAVVAPRAFGIKHMITAGRTGLFLPEGDLAAQVGAVHAALGHPWDRAGISVDTIKTYRPERIAEATVAAYREALRLPPAPDGMDAA